MAIKTVISTGGNFNVAGTWEPSGVPVAGDYIVLGATSGNLNIPSAYNTPSLVGLEVNPSYGATLSFAAVTSTINLGNLVNSVSQATASLIVQRNLKISGLTVTQFNLFPTQQAFLTSNGFTFSTGFLIQCPSGTVSLIDGATFSGSSITFGLNGIFNGGDITLWNVTSFTPPANLNLRAPNKVYIRSNAATITHTNGSWGQSHFVYDIPSTTNYSIPSGGIRLSGASGSTIEFLQRPNFTGAGTWSGLPLMTTQTGISSQGQVLDGTDTLIMSENFTWASVSLFTPGQVGQTMPYQEKRHSFPKGLSTSFLNISAPIISSSYNQYSTASIISSGGTITASNVQLIGFRTITIVGTSSNASYLRLSPDNNYVFGSLQSSTYPSIDNVIMSITPSVPVNITITGETGIVNTELRDINLANKRVLVGDSVTLTRSTGFINNINTSYTYVN